MQPIAIVGNHTDAGKTIAAAILCKALTADYWKPVQSGTTLGTDTSTVKQLLSNPMIVCHPERYSMAEPVSPHLAAQLENMSIELDQIVAPITSRPLIIETAGGLLSPLNDTHTMLDLLEKLRCKVIVVSRHYLGSINHTLLTTAVLKQHNIDVAGILFSGEANPSTESFIQEQSRIPVLGRIPELKEINAQNIRDAAFNLKPHLSVLLK